MFCCFTKLKEKVFEYHSNILLLCTLLHLFGRYVEFSQAFYGLCERQHRISDSSVCRQKDLSSCCVISSSGFPEDLKNSCCAGVALPSTLTDTACVCRALCKMVPDLTVVQGSCWTSSHTAGRTMLFLFSGERVRQRGQSSCLFFLYHHENSMPASCFWRDSQW